MNDKEKEQILRLLLRHSDLKNSSASKLKIYLSNYSTKISLKTIETYQSMIENGRKKYDLKTVFSSHDNDEKIIEDIIKELSRNKKKISANEIHRKKIHNELLKYKDKYKDRLSKNENSISGQNKIKREIKKEICSKLTDIDPKTLNYLYNDEAKDKELDLLPKRSTVDSDFIGEIDTLFKNNVISQYILDQYTGDKSVVQMVQAYIVDNYDVKISLSVIQRYFQKYFGNIKLKCLYKANF